MLVNTYKVEENSKLWQLAPTGWVLTYSFESIDQAFSYT